MATWAKGIDFKNTNNSKRIGGIGVYGTDTTTNKLYIGLGTEPWNNAGLQLTNSAINFKGNKIYHAGDKPTASEIGAAASSHTHNYAGSSSAGGNANAAVKLATARTLTVGNTGKSFNGSANVAWSLSEIGAAAASHTHNSITTKATNTITTTTNDTTANWGAQGHSIHWYTQRGCLNNQPSQYGYILNFGNNAEVHQLWMTQTSGDMAHRGGNSSGWSGSWRILLDSSNYTNYAAASNHTHNYLPLSGGTLTGNLKINGNSKNLTIGTGGSDVYISNSASGKYLQLKDDGTLSYSDNKIYHAGNKPTASEIGAAASSHTHNYAGSSSAGGAANLVYLPRVVGSSVSANYQPGGNRFELKEFANDCANMPSAHWYHILTGQGSDANYNTQLALGMTNNAVYFRNRNSGAWGNWKQLAFTDSSITGNSATATKLKTARTINGTNFDGSANITTAQWGTARTLTIGNSGKSVNGSANVSWSLSEIGALPTAGGTMTGNIVVGNNIGLSHSSNGLFLRHNNGATVLSAKDSTIYFRPKGDLDSSAQVTIDNAGNVTAPKFTGALSGNATTATKLQTARTVKLEGDVTGSFSFDGSANKTFTARRRVAICGQPGTADTTNVYFKVASWSTATNNQDARITFHVTSDFSRSDFGILEVLCRRGSALTKYDKKEITWLTASGINKDNFYLVYGNDGTNTIFEIWMKETSSHICYRFSVLDEGNRTNVNNPWTLYNSQTGKTPSGTASLPSGYTVVNSTFATSSNNATSAATLTTARTLTVGNTGKSFNGSANVSWSLAEIGALPLSGGTMTGNITLNNVKGIYGKTGADLVNADNETVASGTSGAILVYNSAHNLHIGSLIYDKNLVTGSTYVNGAVNLMHRTNNGYIGMQPSRTTTTSFYSTYTNSTVPIKSSVNTGTYLDGNKGRAIISSTNTAGGYTTLIKSNSTNGYFTLNSYQKNLLLAYTDKTTVDAGTNSTTKQAILLDETGNTSFPGKVSASGGFSGNATTASKLQSVRTINGTNFDGSGNITTANWGTARTITIGNTGKSVNGSGNVAWSLSEIGALALSGGTMTGDINMTDGKSIRISTTDTNARLGYDASKRDVFLSNAENNWLRLKPDKTMTYAGHKVYTAFDKPTANEIGALALSGGTLTGETTFNNYLSINSWSGYGTGKSQLWFDGNSKNLIIENTNTLRLGNNVVYHTANKPTPADIGAIPNSKITINKTAPSSPSTGDLWISW